MMTAVRTWNRLTAWMQKRHKREAAISAAQTSLLLGQIFDPSSVDFSPVHDPSMAMGQMPSVEVPSVEVPRVEIPSVEIRRVQIPNVEALNAQVLRADVETAEGKVLQGQLGQVEFRKQPLKTPDEGCLSDTGFNQREMTPIAELKKSQMVLKTGREQFKAAAAIPSGQVVIGQGSHLAALGELHDGPLSLAFEGGEPSPNALVSLDLGPQANPIAVINALIASSQEQQRCLAASSDAHPKRSAIDGDMCQDVEQSSRASHPISQSRPRDLHQNATQHRDSCVYFTKTAISWIAASRRARQSETIT